MVISEDPITKRLAIDLSLPVLATQVCRTSISHMQVERSNWATAAVPYFDVYIYFKLHAVHTKIK